MGDVVDREEALKTHCRVLFDGCVVSTCFKWWLVVRLYKHSKRWIKKVPSNQKPAPNEWPSTWYRTCYPKSLLGCWVNWGVWTFGGGWFGRLGHNDMDAWQNGENRGMSQLGGLNRKSFQWQFFSAQWVSQVLEVITEHGFQAKNSRAARYLKMIDQWSNPVALRGEPIWPEDCQQPRHQDPDNSLRILPHMCFVSLMSIFETYLFDLSWHKWCLQQQSTWLIETPLTASWVIDSVQRYCKCEYSLTCKGFDFFSSGRHGRPPCLVKVASAMRRVSLMTMAS